MFLLKVLFYIRTQGDPLASKNQEAVGIHNQIELLREHTVGRGQYQKGKKPVDHLFVKTAAHSCS